MKRKLLSKTTVWKYDDRTIVHTKTNPEQQLFYFSGNGTPFEWDKGGYVEIAPKPNFITRFKKRLWSSSTLKKIEEYFKNDSKAVKTKKKIVKGK